MASTPELELELQIRGNLILQQQRRIQVLEEELKNAWAHICSLVMTNRDARGAAAAGAPAVPGSAMKVAVPSASATLAGGSGRGASVGAQPKHTTRYWTPDEHARYLEALEKFGPKDAKAIAQYVGTRTPTQVRTHAQKFSLRLQSDVEAPKLGSAAKGTAAESEAGGDSGDDGEEAPAFSAPKRLRMSP